MDDEPIYNAPKIMDSDVRAQARSPKPAPAGPGKPSRA